MKDDYLEIENAENLPQMADATVALDFLLTAKNAVRNCAIALTEVATPQAKSLLRTQLDTAVAMHEAVSKLMIDKGWLHPYDLGEQIQLDMNSAEAALKIAAMPLFPGETDRLGTFATPFK